MSKKKVEIFCEPTHLFWCKSEQRFKSYGRKIEMCLLTYIQNGGYFYSRDFDILDTHFDFRSNRISRSKVIGDWSFHDDLFGVYQSFTRPMFLTRRSRGSKLWESNMAAVKYNPN